jgi:branched-chain amino acid transport system permease protein
MSEAKAATQNHSPLTVDCRQRMATLLRGGRGALAVPLLLAALILVYPALSSSAYWLREIPLIAVLALVVSGVNLSFGYAGELQLGQVFMFALGAYVSMSLAVRGFTDVVALMLIGGIAAVLVGVIVALPSLRIGGWSLALASFFLVITIPDLVTLFGKYTGGLNGLFGIPNPTLFGNALGTVGLYEVTTVTLVLWFACYRNLVTSRYGVVFRTLRESAVLTRSLGFSPLRLKTTVYALGAFPAGVAGCLYGYVTLILEPSSFGLTLGIGAVAASVLGGVESVYGIAIGAAILQLGPEKSAAFANYAPVAYGAFLVIAAILLRGGVALVGKRGVARVADWIEPAQDPPTVPPWSEASQRPAELGNGRPATGEASHHVPELRPLPGKRLEVVAVKKTFGGVAALQGVSLTAEPGEVLALIGANGSGKTTLMNVICGYHSPQEGSVKLDGEEISGLRPEQIARLGVARTFQTPVIPRGITVRDAVASGRYRGDHAGVFSAILRLPKYWRAQRADRHAAIELLELVGLGELAGVEAAALPLGKRRLVEVVRAVCARPGLVLLDEPASGLNEEEVETLARLVRDLAATGATVVVIEHNFRFVTTVSRVVHVLHLGRSIAHGSPDAVASERQVIESYLGQPRTPSPESSSSQAIHTIEHRTGETDDPGVGPLLVVRSLESGYGDLLVLRGLSLSIMPGTIEVVLGRNGVGKTTLVSTLAGLLPTWSGSIELGGVNVGREPAYRRASCGIALVQEGKRIFRHRTVWQNVLLGTNSLKLSSRERDALCRSALERFPVLSERLSEAAGRLSGGQQQMLAIAQALASRPRMLLLDEPSAGLAPSIVDGVFQQLRTLADAGLTILLVEQLAEKALVIADHVTVLDNGQVITTGHPLEFNDPKKLEMAYFGA